VNPADSPLVTVVINAYNGAAYLREAIDSVYAQSLQDFEIVLFDDASTDATPEIARSFDARLRYARAEKQVPLGEARNRALEFARGRYICFLDQDDLFLPRKLERQVAAFCGEVALVFSNSIRIWESTGKEALHYASPPPDGDAFRALLRWYYLSINTVMIRRDALPEDRNWWFPPAFRMCEETDLFLRIAHAYPIAYVDEPLAKYRIHGKNFSISHREFLVIEERAIMERLAARIPDFAALYADEIAAYTAEINRTEAQIEWKKGSRRKAWAAYARGMRLNPKLVYLAEWALSVALPFEALPAIRAWIGKPIL
jgi:glycosyltransferase involved in cell wall biosynthesis